MLDELDKQITHALQIDGRVPFNRVAEVLGVSDQTVARRYRRLRREEAVRVIGNVDNWRTGTINWTLRIQCVPDAALAIAEALARRPDTAWVRLGSGGTEISCATRSQTKAETDELLLHRLHRTPRIVGISAHCLIHSYYDGDQSYMAKSGGLAPEQVAALTPDWKSEPTDEPLPPFGAADKALLAALSRDGRASYAELAAATGGSETTVRRRLTELRRSGAVYFDVDVPARALGMEVEAMMWLSVAPRGMAEAAETLAGHPEVPFVAATTGPTNIVASLICRNVSALYEYITTRVAAIPAIQHIETNPIVRTLKREGAIL